MNPDDLLFSKTHEWISIEESAGEKIATLGISAFAVEALTDLVYIELPKVGQQVEVEKPFCEVESVKAVSDIYAPLDGEVVAVNESLPDSLEKLGTDPYGEGWIAKIKISDEAGLATLMEHDTYQKQCDEAS